MKWNNEEVRYPYVGTTEEKAEYLAVLKEQKRELQQEQTKLRNLLFRERRREIAVRLSLLQRQIDRREREM